MENEIWRITRPGLKYEAGQKLSKPKTSDKKRKYKERVEI
jgi:hypothetical protein